MVNLDQLVNEAYSVVPPNTPKDTGNLLSAITTIKASNTRIETILNGSTAIYGIFLDDASSPFKGHKGFFTNNIFNAQVDRLNNILTGQVNPLGEMMQQGLVGEISPAQNEAYLRSLASYDKNYFHGYGEIGNTGGLDYD